MLKWKNGTFAPSFRHTVFAKTETAKTDFLSLRFAIQWFWRRYPLVFDRLSNG